MSWLCLAFAFPAVCLSQSYQQRLIKSADGSEIRFWIIHPENTPAEQQRPVVIALHGCGGLYSTEEQRRGHLNSRHDGMARLLTRQGYSVVMPDSFSSRGETRICAQKMSDRKIKQTQRRNDVTGVLTWLAGSPWVDQQKIALLGWSHGGSAVLAATNGADKAVSGRNLQPSVAIAFYPGCADALRSSYRPTAPLVLLLGELDDWTPVAPCLELAKRVDAKAVVFADSHHGFDNPVGEVKLRSDVPNGKYPGRGVHAGRNPVTGPQAWQMVVDSLSDHWALRPPN